MALKRPEDNTITDIDGNRRHFTVLDEIRHEQSTHPEKLIYLQRLRFEDDESIELCLAYYIIGKKPRMAGKWVWGQFATMIPVEDLKAVIRKATKEGRNLAYHASIEQKEDSDASL